MGFDIDNLEIGLIGQGNVAELISKHLINAGFSLHVLESQFGNKNDIVVNWHSSLVSLSRKCSIIITIVADSFELEELLFGDAGITQYNLSNRVIIDMSSVSPEFIQELSEKFSELDVPFLDAAIIHENPNSSDAIQMILIGGEESIYKSVLPVFEKIAANVKHIGINGASQFYRQAFGVRKRRS